MDAATCDLPPPSGPGAAAQSLLAARRAFQYRLGLLLVALGIVVLLVVLLAGLVHELGWGPRTSLLTLAAVVFAATPALVVMWRRQRHHGLWAKPFGEPSLAAPSEDHTLDATTLTRIRSLALTVGIALAAVAIASGASF